MTKKKQQQQEISGDSAQLASLLLDIKIGTCRSPLRNYWLYITTSSGTLLGCAWPPVNALPAAASIVQTMANH